MERERLEINCNWNYFGCWNDSGLAYTKNFLFILFFVNHFKLRHVQIIHYHDCPYLFSVHLLLEKVMPSHRILSTIPSNHTPLFIMQIQCLHSNFTAMHVCCIIWNRYHSIQVKNGHFRLITWMTLKYLVETCNWKIK